MMIFNEIYSSYYRVLTEILTSAASRPIATVEIRETIKKYAFLESEQIIPQKLESGDWPLLKNNRSVLTREPQRPASLLERRWLAAILTDPRVQLFLPSDDNTPTITAPPLWQESDIVYYDRHLQGDPFQAPSYIRNFRRLLSAVREKKEVAIRYVSRKGRFISCTGTILQVEYSPKDDKFRFLLLSKGHPQTLNAGNIQTVTPLDQPAKEDSRNSEKPSVTVEITDERNALNRAMLHFSDLVKTTKAIDGKTYRMTIQYNPADEVEILIRLLSFGPFVKVIEPEDMVEKVKERLVKQRGLVISNQ